MNDARNDWWPIATAPKEGSPVLLFARLASAEASTRVVGAWSRLHDTWLAQSYGGQGLAPLVPSHWQPLPPFPNEPPAPEHQKVYDSRGRIYGQTVQADTTRAAVMYLIERAEHVAEVGHYATGDEYESLRRAAETARHHMSPAA